MSNAAAARQKKLDATEEALEAANSRIHSLSEALASVTSAEAALRSELMDARETHARTFAALKKEVRYRLWCWDISFVEITRRYNAAMAFRRWRGMRKLLPMPLQWHRLGVPHRPGFRGKFSR